MATAGASRGSGPERAYAPDLPPEGDVVLDAEESAHLVRSRRAQAGDGVVLFDGQGTARRGRLLDADPRAARVVVEGTYPGRTPARSVRMAVALPEMGRADRMIQALAELGVEALAPLVCERSASGRAEQAKRRAVRWGKLAREACKVNGCARALGIEPAIHLTAALEAGAILLDPDPDAVGLSSVMGAVSRTAWLLVGPEGGFTDAEVAEARAVGTPVARLGATALRVETAAIAAAAILLGA